MSSKASRDLPNPNDPNDPLHFAPPSVRSRANPQTGPLRPTSSRPGFDEVHVIAKSRRHPLDPEFVQPPVPPRARFSVASRFTAAIGVVAIIGVIFFLMIPKSQGSDPTSAVPDKASEESQALLQKFIEFEKSKEDPSAAAQKTPDDSKMLLQKFMQWQQKRP
jgi:hypothetical protein